jgi:hypothetical protein
MLGIEAACAAIVALYVAVRLGAPGARTTPLVARLSCLACAAWLGEDSVIRAYGFYGYAAGWSVFLDRVPLLIVVIWPVVIDSAHSLARCFVKGPGRVALAGGLIVLADASLIEPIAVRAGLWSWSSQNARSVFDVPVIGILGWAYFAAAAIFALETVHARGAAAPEGDLIVVPVAPAAAHVVLVATWWALFRWLPEGLLVWTIPVAAWALTVPVTLAAWRMRADVPVRAVLARAPGAAFFFALLATAARGRPDLVVYALAFAPPYLALLGRGERGRPTSAAP